MNAEVHLRRKSKGQGCPPRWIWFAKFFENTSHRGTLTWHPAPRLLRAARREIIEVLAHLGFAPSDIEMIVHKK